MHSFTPLFCQVFFCHPPPPSPILSLLTPALHFIQFLSHCIPTPSATLSFSTSLPPFLSLPHHPLSQGFISECKAVCVFKLDSQKRWTQIGNAYCSHLHFSAVEFCVSLRHRVTGGKVEQNSHMNKREGAKNVVSLVSSPHYPSDAPGSHTHTPRTTYLHSPKIFLNNAQARHFYRALPVSTFQAHTTSLLQLLSIPLFLSFLCWD